jgi:hypothetical protein
MKHKKYTRKYKNKNKNKKKIYNKTQKTRKTQKINNTKTNKNKNKTFKKAKCSPGSKEFNFTCYSKKELLYMKKRWNIRHPDCKIKTNKPIQIWRFLKKNLSKSCNIETCWINNKFPKLLKKQKHIFAPKYPNSWRKKSNEWLSSVDIMNVMKQYEHQYKCFDFIGPSPIDYDTHILNGECVWKELCEFNLKNHINNKKNKIGVIFNLDPHYKQGSHWVALFINIQKKQINYFDSYGEDPEPQIYKFIKNIYNQGSKLNILFDININKIRHQFSDSECGMYSLYFIIQMLNDTSISKLFNTKIPDKTVYKLRKQYFEYNS